MNMKTYVINAVHYCYAFLYKAKSWAGLCLIMSTWTADLLICTLSANKCTVRHEAADCSHLKLTPNTWWPPNKHNCVGILPIINSEDCQLPILQDTANLLSWMGDLTPSQSWARTVSKSPWLEILNLQHNEISQLSDKTFIFCMNLTELHLMSNTIQKIQNDPFKNLKVRRKWIFLCKKWNIYYQILFSSHLCVIRLCSYQGEDFSFFT